MVCLVRPCLDDGMGCSDSLCLIGLLFAQVVRVAIVNLPACLRLSATSQKDRKYRALFSAPKYLLPFFFFLFVVFSNRRREYCLNSHDYSVGSFVAVFFRILLPKALPPLLFGISFFFLDSFWLC